MQDPADCLVHVKTSEGVKLRTVFETINPILVEGSVTFTKRGMSIKAVNILILCDMLIEASKVEEYVCVEDQRVSINFNTFYSCISSVGQDDTVCMQLTEEGLNAVVPYISLFVINRSADDEYIFSYRVTMLALVVEDFDVPDTTFDAVVSIPSSSFQRVLRNCEKRGSHVQICTATCQPATPHGAPTSASDVHYIIFATDGDDASLTFHMRLRPEDIERPTDAKNRDAAVGASLGGNDAVSGATCRRDVACMKQELYSLKHLLLLTKATHLGAYVTLYLAHDFVLGVKYNIGTIGYITFCVVPHCDKSETLPPIKPDLASSPSSRSITATGTRRGLSDPGSVSTPTGTETRASGLQLGEGGRQGGDRMSRPEPGASTTTNTAAATAPGGGGGATMVCSGSNLSYDIFTRAKKRPAKRRRRVRPRTNNTATKPASNGEKDPSGDDRPQDTDATSTRGEFAPSKDLVMPRPPPANEGQ